MTLKRVLRRPCAPVRIAVERSSSINSPQWSLDARQGLPIARFWLRAGRARHAVSETTAPSSYRLNSVSTWSSLRQSRDDRSLAQSLAVATQREAFSGGNEGAPPVGTAEHRRLFGLDRSPGVIDDQRLHRRRLGRATGRCGCADADPVFAIDGPSAIHRRASLQTRDAWSAMYGRSLSAS